MSAPVTTPPTGVPWRRVLWIVLGVAALVAGTLALVRGGGFDASSAQVGRATRWFVHPSTGRVVLADGYSGKTVARLPISTTGRVRVAEGTSGAYLLDVTRAQVHPIDRANLRLGPAAGVAALSDNGPTVSVTDDGLVVVDNQAGDAVLVSPDGQSTPFDVETDGRGRTEVASDSTVWSLDGASLVGTTPSGLSTRTDVGTGGALLSMMGDEPIVLDQANSRARVGDGVWVELPGVPGSELVVQAPGPDAACAWIGANDVLWCIDERGLVREVTVSGLDVEGSDQLAIAGDAATVVHRSPPGIVRFSWRAASILVDDPQAFVPATADLQVSVGNDLVWIDDVAGDHVWAVNPWGLQAIRKDDPNALDFGDDGDVILESVAPDDGGASSTGEMDMQTNVPEPDDNGIDDPPIAVPDQVTARAGTTVGIPVTGNDYDPDGEAIAVSEVKAPGHGTAVIASASTVSYAPEAGYAGTDTFEYTIVDGNGTEATATVTVQLLAADAVNQAPKATDDAAETSENTPVDISVLANDLDPERDPLRIGEFASDQGSVSATVGRDGLPALHFVPATDFFGSATLTYEAEDVRGARSEKATVTVDVASRDQDNRPPRTAPDAVRVRRDLEIDVPVLANDVDPDGDKLSISLVGPSPDGVTIEPRGDVLRVTARAGAGELVPFSYQVDDGNGGTAVGSVLVQVFGAEEPNQPPLANADTATVVLGRSVDVNVVGNDSDPDGDPLIVMSAGKVVNGQATVVGNKVRFTPSASALEGATGAASFTYSVADGHGHEVSADVSVQVLAERLAQPPWARDDSATTYVGEPVSIDVLDNDGDPSGATPAILGRVGCPSGDAVVTAASNVLYTPAPDTRGVVRCQYQVANDQSLTASASIVISVQQRPVANQPPVARPDSMTTAPGVPVTVPVLGNDSDPDGDPLTLVRFGPLDTGSAAQVDDSIVVTPPVTTSATVISFTYQVSDGRGGIGTGRVTVQVIPPVVEKQPPLAADDLLTATAPAPATVFNVLVNDVDPDGDRASLRVTDASLQSGSGTASVTSSTVTLRPDATFVGTMIARYTITDADGLPATANAVLIVSEPLNRPPNARSESAQVTSGESVTVDVLANDTDPDNDPLSISLVSRPEFGAVQVSGGSITYTAPRPQSGSVSIGYAVSDGELQTNASLNILVVPCTGTPRAADVALRTGYQQPIAIDLTPYASGGTITSVEAPLGQAVGTYTPPAGENGNVVFHYTVSDDCGGSALGTVTIDVNQDPVAGAITVPIRLGGSQTVPVSQLASDSEVLTITGLQGDVPGWVAFGPSALQIDPSVAGSATFGVVVADPGGLTAVATVTVVVTNNAPIAVDDTADVTNGDVTVDLLANDSDPDGHAIELWSLPTQVVFDDGRVATIEKQGGGTVLINLQRRRVFGTVTFQYTVRDAYGLESNPATVTVVGRAPPTTEPPMAPPTEPPTVPPTEPPTVPPTEPPTTTAATTVPPATSAEPTTLAPG